MTKLIPILFLVTLMGCEGEDQIPLVSGIICEEVTACELQCYIDHDYNACVSAAAVAGVGSGHCVPILTQLDDCLDKEL